MDHQYLILNGEDEIDRVRVIDSLIKFESGKQFYDLVRQTFHIMYPEIAPALATLSDESIMDSYLVETAITNMLMGYSTDDYFFVDVPRADFILVSEEEWAKKQLEWEDKMVEVSMMYICDGIELLCSAGYMKENNIKTFQFE